MLEIIENLTWIKNVAFLHTNKSGLVSVDRVILFLSIIQNIFLIQNLNISQGNFRRTKSDASCHV